MAKKKNNVDLFGDETSQGPQSEFAALLNSSGVVARGLSPGDRFRGEVLAVSGAEAFLSTGTPTDAVLPLSASATDHPKVGEFVEVMVVRVRDGEILVKLANAKGVSAETDSLEDAFDMEIPVEGNVVEAVKGGFRVKVQGLSAFCPISQIDWRCVRPEDYVGKKFEFIITKMERGRDLVVSRRKLLELERANFEGEFLHTAEVGAIFSATVVRIEKYGAFVRLQSGIEGLIPIGELSWNRIRHPQEVVQLDQNVQVKLLEVKEDGDRLRVSFSVKQGGGEVDPWTVIDSQFPVGSTHEGIVEHKENYGLFVRLGPGVSGLLPRSKWRDDVNAKEFENKRAGESVKVRIDTVDPIQRKISLGLPGDDDDQAWRAHTSLQAKSGASMGTLADLLKGVKIK